jgi:hypothetical protein
MIPEGLPIHGTKRYIDQIGHRGHTSTANAQECTQGDLRVWHELQRPD